MRRRLFLGAAVLAAAAACSRPSETAKSPEADPPEKTRSVYLFLGDSLTAGYGVAKQDAYPALLAERWRKIGLAVRVRNAGVSGATTAGILENLDWHLTEDVHTVFLAIGANDGMRGHDLEETRSNLAREAVLVLVRERCSSGLLKTRKVAPLPEVEKRLVEHDRSVAGP